MARYNGEYCYLLGTISERHNFSIAVRLMKKGPLGLKELKKELGFSEKMIKKHLNELMECKYVLSGIKEKTKVFYLNNQTFEKILRIIENHIKQHQKK